MIRLQEYAQGEYDFVMGHKPVEDQSPSYYEGYEERVKEDQDNPLELLEDLES
jgi:hypothetical protein